jgi:cytochrome c553
MAQGYLAQVRAFDAAPSVQTFNAALSGCAACHEATCGGPLTVIEGLKLR